MISIKFNGNTYLFSINLPNSNQNKLLVYHPTANVLNKHTCNISVKKHIKKNTLFVEKSEKFPLAMYLFTRRLIKLQRPECLNDELITEVYLSPAFSRYLQQLVLACPFLNPFCIGLS